MSGAASKRELTPEQRQAVQRRRGSLLLAAGAGSGKTAVLVERFVAAVLEDGVAPSAILAITFTERAAWEMAERLRLRLRELGQRDLAREVESAIVGTFHGFCARLLRTDPLAAGVAPGFAVLAEGVAARTRREAFDEALRAVIAERSQPAVDLAAAYRVDRLRAMVLGVHAQLRSRGQRHPRLPGLASVVSAAGTATAGAGADAADPVLRSGPPGAAADAADPVLRSGRPGAGADAADPVLRSGRPVAPELACELIGLLLARFDEAYEARKLRRGAVDFDDLELGALQLLQESEALREQWAQRFEMIMVDEFQDTNPRQLELLAAIGRDNVFMVGDEWQSIYGFRHADVGIFRERSAELGRRGAGLALTLSFRSVPGVIDAVNRVFSERFGERYTPLRATRAGPDEPNAQRAPAPRAVPAPQEVPDAQNAPNPQDPPDGPNAANASNASNARDAPDAPDAMTGAADAVEVLLTDRDGWGDDPELAARVGEGLPDSSPWRHAEARHLARRVDDLIREGRYGPGDVAVLLRATKDLYVYERALAARGVPTLATAGGFWSGEEVRDVLAYLRALANPLDEMALYGVLASPLVGVSADSLALIAARARAGSGAGLWRVVQDLSTPSGAGERDALPGRDGELLAGFCERFAGERPRLAERSLARVIGDVVAASGYLQRVGSGRDGSRAEANLRKLARLASEYERSEARDLRGFIDHAEHLADGGAGSEPDAPVAEDRLGAVRLMSIHAAKGLEFPVVCVADLGRSPGRGAGPDMILDGDRIGLRLLGLDGGDPQPVLDYEELLAGAREAEAEEEDRILYVAMTRARDLLILSGACKMRPRSRSAASSASIPIEWLAGALIDDLQQRLDAGADAPSARPVDAGADAPSARPVGVGVRDGAPRLLVYGPATAAAALPAPAEPRGQVRGERSRRSVVERSGEAVAPDGQPAERRPAPATGTLSYTSLTRMERCGYRYYLEATLGLPERERFGEGPAGVGPPAPARARAAGAGRRPPDRRQEQDGRPGQRPRDQEQEPAPAHARGRPPASARATGELAHAVLQRMDFARDRGPQPAEIARLARELGIEIGRAAGERMAEMLGGLIGTELAARIAAAEHLDAEQPFAFSIGRDQPLIVGTFDLLVRERDGRCLVVDYKSGGRDGEDLEGLVREQFGAQRLIYALAALSGGAEQVEVVHWFLRRPERPVSERYGSAEAQALSGTLRERIERVRERGFAVSERPHRGLCESCPGRRALCSWSERETLRELPVS